MHYLFAYLLMALVGLAVFSQAHSSQASYTSSDIEAVNTLAGQGEDWLSVLQADCAGKGRCPLKGAGR